MRIVAFSDTHGQHRKLTVPDGDVLVFAGDMMTCGYKTWERDNFAEWFRALPHKHKIVTAGNHDRALENISVTGAGLIFHGCHYLIDSGCVINGFQFWGSPYTPEFNNWAFQIPRSQGYKHWDLIPTATDVLITHGPPYGILDGPYRVRDKHLGWVDQHLGCPELAERLEDTGVCWHIFGHVHGSYGQMINIGLGVDHYNVSVCNDQYKLVNPCTVIDI